MAKAGGQASATSGLKAAVLVLLKSAPDKWAELDYDGLTPIQQKALTALVAAAFVECRCDLHLQLANHGMAFKAAFEATGETGMLQALEPFLAALSNAWFKTWQAWRVEHGDTRMPFLITGKMTAWRLTPAGVEAKRDAGSDFPALYVLRLPPLQQRPTAAGYGHLLNFEESPRPQTGAPTVNVGNWKDGADDIGRSLTAVLGPMLEQMAERMAAAAPAAGGEKNTVPTPMPGVDDADSEILEYLNRRPTFYHEKGQISLERGPTNRKTISKRLEEMEKRGLVEVNTKGVRILPLGQQVLKLSLGE